jgi:hypothetical protein
MKTLHSQNKILKQKVSNIDNSTLELVDMVYTEIRILII